MEITNEVRLDLSKLIELNLSSWKEYLGKYCDGTPHEENFEDSPSNDLTIGLNDSGSIWGYQTGDNSFTGGAYGLPHWAVVSFTKETNELELFNDLMEQIEQIETNEE